MLACLLAGLTSLDPDACTYTDMPLLPLPKKHKKTHTQFEESYLETLHRLHGTKRVRANQIYQE